MLFLFFSNANIQFARKKHTWRSYITTKALLTIRWVEIIDKKKIIKAALNENIEAFVMHMTSLSLNLLPIHPTWEAQIGLLIAKEVQILFKYLDFLDVFSKKKALILLEVTELNQYAIELQKI